MCGDTIMFGSDQAGSSAGNGSVVHASSAAPPRTPARSACTRAISSIVAPRPTLSSHADGLNLANSAAPIIFAVAGVIGRVETTKSQSGSRSRQPSSSTTRSAPPTARPLRFDAQMRMPKASARLMISRPMPPAPSTSNVLPYSSSAGSSRAQLCARWASRTASVFFTMVSIVVNTHSAIGIANTPAPLVSTMFRSARTSSGHRSTPAPGLCSHRNDGA